MKTIYAWIGIITALLGIGILQALPRKPYVIKLVNSQVAQIAITGEILSKMNALSAFLGAGMIVAGLSIAICEIINPKKRAEITLVLFELIGIVAIFASIITANYIAYSGLTHLNP